MDQHDDEAPKDPRAEKEKHQSFDEKDFEGHRAHTVFVGVHVPTQRRHSHKHKKHHHRTSDGDKSASEEERPRVLVSRRRGLSISEDGEICTPPSQRVQFILGEDLGDEKHESHPLFSEMEELFVDGDEMEWKETARWIKFEEDVEEGGNRWSKPHVATLSLHSLFELRSLILNGTVILDMDASSIEQIADLVIDNMVNNNKLDFTKREKVKEALLKRHRHQHQRHKHGLPFIRSLQEIGRNHSTSKSCFTCVSVPTKKKRPRNNIEKNGSNSLVSVEEQSLSEQSGKPDFGKFLNVPGQGHEKPVRILKSASNVSISRNTSSSDLSNDLPQHNLAFMKKIPPGAEASNILVGEVDFLEKPLSAFIRLNTAQVLGDLTEVPVPTRFMFILLGPTNSTSGYHEIGRAMATLMSDEVFHEVAYKARNRGHLLAGVDEFLDAVTVLPPGEWDPAIRIEPPAAVPSQDNRKKPPEKVPEDFDEEEEEQKLREESGLARTGVLFGGLKNDLKRKIPWYWSDFKDAIALQCVASWIFLYFACLSPIITFGGLLAEATGKHMAAMESLVAGFVCGMGYGFFSGQPLTILGSTGPVLVFETIVYDFCTRMDWDYMSFRFWIGTWITVILLILVAIDASALVCYITRFTEENFATLIAFIFIYKAVENVLLIGKNFPINTSGSLNFSFECSCLVNDSVQVEHPEIANWTSFNKTICNKLNGTLVGYGCTNPPYAPDVFLMSILLFIGTFLLSVELKDFKNALFFPSKVRQFISDFAVIIAIVSMTLLDFWSNIPTPKLQVPHEFKPTLPSRGWIIPPFGRNPFYSIILALAPALLGTILIFMDQQITCVIVNRKEFKLKKGCGYHLDLFVLAILIQICSVMGLPWFVAATVLSINHVNSLKLESECAAPGEKPQFLGVREQRVTHILIFLTIGLSVFLTPMLGHIPMPVLFGVFLYMGVSSLKGLQFFERILIMFMPNKYQPDYMFLRQVPIKRVHLFTLIQLACLICLWSIKSFSSTSILFPLMLVVMIGIRKSLDWIFTRRELKILDDLMPEVTRRHQLLKDQKDVEDPCPEQNLLNDNLKIPLANGKIMNIPISAINISEEVNKTGIWKQVNDGNVKSKPKTMPKKLSPRKVSRLRKTKPTKKDAELNKKLEKKLSIMNEEEDEDEGITMKRTNPKDTV
ncbi:electroneutral sodium bicarbonate exchanger 1 isoform X3 [Anthonomus grandis grandis]|uniref:electroneutral sodium bicarbonate exchanger 1 isoform X3 n=1 Tax=Anthonomus grandis grandis TaxID=2921223 RepID=UPI002166C06D|nr:electroneutral sodium bicarbonate exchanger 1 isoform X3 [Anthonomus grandis grandis]